MMLSIIIPVYNVEKYLDDCFSSLKFLKNKIDVEIIIVNDGSTDNSFNITKSWEATFKNLKIINQQNQGLSAARNAGLSLSHGDYISFIDSDDFINSKSLWSLLIHAKENDADIAIGDYWEYIDEHPEISPILKSIPAKRDYSYNGFDFFHLYYKPLQSVVVRNIYKRSFLIDNNLKFHEGICFEDVEFTPIAFCKAKTVIYSGIPFYYYRKRNNSITTSRSTEKKVLDAIKVWHALDVESGQINNSSISRIFRELGFHCFLNQYSLLDKDMQKSVLYDAKSLSKNGMKTLKYRIISCMFKLLPDDIFHKLLKNQR